MTAACEPASSNPIDRLLTALDVIQEHAPPDVACWFGLGVDSFMRRAASLDEGLLLTSEGNERRPLTTYQTRQRNRYLRAAWECCSGKSSWARSCELARQVRLFDSAAWPRLRRLDSPPKGSSDLRKALFAAFRCAIKDDAGSPVVPKTARQLHEIVK